MPLTDRQCGIPPTLVAALADVRDDKTPSDWCLAGLVGETSELALIGSGSGSTAALASHLNSNGMYYGLVRTTEQIDDSTTVKFVFISFVGDDIPVMRRAKVSFHCRRSPSYQSPCCRSPSCRSPSFPSPPGRSLPPPRVTQLSTFKGTVTEAYSPFHAELLNASSVQEVSAAAVSGLLQQMFGKATDVAGDVDKMRIGQRTVNVTQKNTRQVTNHAAQAQAISSPSELAEVTLLALTLTPCQSSQRAHCGRPASCRS